MLTNRGHLYVLALIFFGVLGFRLFFVFQVDGFTGDNSYANLRQIEYISENYKPMSHDELSYSGKELLVSPFFYYFMAFFRFFASDIFVFKVLPAILMSLVSVVIFLITFEMTHNKTAALFSALISGFIPLVIEKTLNSISVYSLFLLFFLLLFYFLVKILNNETAYVDWFVFLSFLLPLIHPGALIFVVALLFYVVLMMSELFTIKPLLKELILFTTFLVTLIEFVIYKEAFLKHGFSLIQYNLPSRIIENYFLDFSIFSLLYSIGVVSFILGCIGIYAGFFKSKDQRVFLFIGLILSVMLMLLLKAIDFFSGMLFLGIAFSILTGYSLRMIYNYLSNMKLRYATNLFNMVLFLVILFFSIFPSYVAGEDVMYNAFTKDEIDALKGLRDYQRGVVLADIEEGNAVNYYSNKPSMLDSNFLLVDNPNYLVREAKLTFLGANDALTKERIEENAITYVYFSFRTRDRYSVSSFLYSRDNDCVELLNQNEKYQIFRVVC